MSALFRNLARQKKVPVTVHLNGKKMPTELYFGGSQGREPRVRLNPETSASVNGDPVKIAFLNKAMFFLFETRLRHVGDDTYSVDKPQVIYSSFRRMLPRYRFGEGKGGMVTFYDHPCECPLVDISTEGFSFLCDEKLWSGREIVRNITLHLDSGAEIRIDGRVRYYRKEKDGRYLYGLRISEQQWFPRYELFKYIARKTYSNIRWIEEFTDEEVHALYDKSGYLSLKSREEMEHSFTNMLDAYEKIRDKKQISASPVYFSDDKMLTVCSVLRIYDRTFLGHQLASLPEARMNLKSKTDVYLVLADFLIDHLYCENYLSYFDISLPWHQEIFRRIGSYIDDKNKFVFDELEFFECHTVQTETVNEGSEFAVDVLEGSEQFRRFCHWNLDPIEVGCYAYDEKHFNLREISQVYEVLDLYVSRRLWAITKKSKVVAYAVAEAYSDGLNCFNLLDMCRVYFSAEAVAKRDILKALLPNVGLFFRKFKKDRFYVVFKCRADVKTLEFRGLEHRHSAGRVMMSRPGIVEYRTVLSMNSRQGG